MGFKKLVLLAVICEILLPLAVSTCWLSRTPKIIQELDISISTQREFSLHPTSGVIMAKQYRNKAHQNIYFGDFGVLRMYTPQLVTVYEGAYMKIMPLLHYIEPWLTSKYALQNVLELQVMYGFTFGKKQSKFYSEIGMTYFIAGVKTDNSTQIEASRQFVNELLSLEKGKKFKLEEHFKPSSSGFANNVYMYEAPEPHLQKFLPLASDKPKSCQETLWILQRTILKIDLGNFNRLKSQLKVSENLGASVEIKAQAAKLRKDNKEQASHEVLNNKMGGKSSEQESNSCRENQQL